MDNLNESDLLEIAKTSTALTDRSKETGKFAYPEKWNGKVPLKVKILKTVTSDMPMFFPDASDMIAVGNNEYYAYVNRYGALSAILHNGKKLGLKPDEFEVIQFHD